MSGRVYDYLAMLFSLCFVVLIAIVFSEFGYESVGCEQRSTIELCISKGEK